SSRTSSSMPGPRAALICVFQFMTFPCRLFRLQAEGSRRPDLRDAVQRDEERVPHAALAGQCLATGAGELVIAAAALAGALDPAPFDPAAIFEAVERGVERRDVEADRPVRPLGDQLADVIAVPRPLFEQRQDQQFGAAAL